MAAPHVFLLAPIGPGAGLTTVTLGTVRALDRAGLRVGFYKPIGQPGRDGEEEPSSRFVRETSDLAPPATLPWSEAEASLAGGDDDLMQQVVARAQQYLDAHDVDVLLVEGLVPTADHPDAAGLNARLAAALDAEVILVVAEAGSGAVVTAERLERAAGPYGGLREGRLIGAIVNKVGMAAASEGAPALGAMPVPLAGPHGDGSNAPAPKQLIEAMPIFRDDFQAFGAVPFEPSWLAPRTLDLARHLGASVRHEGELHERRIAEVAVIARTVANMTHRLRPGALLITPGDRDDVILAVAMAAISGTPLAGLVLTGGIEPDPRIMRLCERAFAGGLPLLTVASDSYVTAARAADLDLEVPADDPARIALVMDGVAEHLNVEALAARCRSEREPRLSPPAFLHRFVTRAAAVHARIVLPEGDEPRTVRAAVSCHRRGIARCLLLADATEVQRVAEAQGLTLPSDLEIVRPTTRLRERYVADMVELRKHKGMTAPIARQQLEDNVVLGTMMLARGEVDGLVSGAVHTTASTVRPALQLIKTREDAKLISSVFFMCLPDQVVVYGDCAINPDPNAEELADIAIQSAVSAQAFGIEPRVAMLSYSTGASSSGSDVDKVREATRIVRELRPDLVVDGPLQYDAASVASVARSKAPDSPVAGRATVLIFPDLNTGNTTYKAVQRSAGVISIGPMLQGLRRPVNDLSRGALVDDIVYTIALTAIQAGQARTAVDAAAR